MDIKIHKPFLMDSFSVPSQILRIFLVIVKLPMSLLAISITELQLKIGDFFMLPIYLFLAASLPSVLVSYSPEQNVFFWCYKILQCIRRSPI
ncbi:hypothetical protein SPPR111872_00375 [Sphingobacterium prati]